MAILICDSNPKSFDINIVEQVGHNAEERHHIDPVIVPCTNKRPII